MSSFKDQTEDQLRENFLNNEVREISDLLDITLEEARVMVYREKFPQRLYEIWKKKEKSKK